MCTSRKGTLGFVSLKYYNRNSSSYLGCTIIIIIFFFDGSFKDMERKKSFFFTTLEFRSSIETRVYWLQIRDHVFFLRPFFCVPSVRFFQYTRLKSPVSHPLHVHETLEIVQIRCSILRRLLRLLLLLRWWCPWGSSRAHWTPGATHGRMIHHVGIEAWKEKQKQHYVGLNPKSKLFQMINSRHTIEALN